MADEENIQEEEGQAQSEQKEPETDWKGLARKWEARAKENWDKAQEFDKLKEAQMSETEKLNKKLEDATSKLRDLEAEKERNGWVNEVATETGLSIAQLKALAATSKEDLLEKAALFVPAQEEQEEPQGMPVVLGDGTHASHEPSETPDEWFRSTIPSRIKQ